ncbi:MAG: methyl-accepting chemotaxis protein [Polyangiaceae bacterium]
MRPFRVPMFVKFLLGCFTLAALLIAGGAFVFKRQARQPSQGNFLAKHLRRYQGYEERVGRGLTGALEILSEDPRLRTAIEAQSPAGPRGDAAPLIAGMFDKLSTKNGIQPEFLALFDAKNKLLSVAPSAAAPVRADDLPELAPVARAREGSTFAHRLVMLDGVPYQVSAIPIRNANDEVIGGLLAGVPVERYFREYAEQTDEVVERRIRPTILKGQEVLASAFGADQQATLGRALQPDKVFKSVVNDEERDTVKLGGADSDVYFENLEAWVGPEKTSVAKIVMTRQRAPSDEGSKIPWLEMGIGAGLSVVIALGMAYWITRPIKQFVRQSQELLSGDTDLTQRIEVRSRDETADLAENINQVFARVHGLATGVQTAALQVGASSAEISAASKQMLGGIKDQSLKIESSTAAITELSASIQQVAENAAQATDVANKSNVAVTSAVERMGDIQTAVDDAAEKMRELGESSKRIGKIVEVIRQISEQTSLLALNAAIQAAQAGEQGRGFAVVADEVSSLARRAGESVKDIEALIQTIKEQTSAAIASMEKGTHEVESGTELVSATLGDLGKLIDVVRETATAVQEQAVVSDEIARNMDAVQTIASEVLTGSEESVVQAERLHELAYELESSVAGFNLDGARPAAHVDPAPPPAPPTARRIAQRPPARALPASTAPRQPSAKPRALAPRPAPRRG